MDPNKMINFSELIAAPLSAAIEADAEAAQKTAEFIQKYGFTQSADGSSGLKMVTFGYQRVNAQTGAEETVEVQVPVLSLVPIPLLQVKNIEFKFAIEMQFSEQTKTSSGQKPASEEPGSDRPAFKAKLSPNQGDSSSNSNKSVSSNMSINVVMQRADMPAGLINLMPMFADSTSTRVRALEG